MASRTRKRTSARSHRGNGGNRGRAQRDDEGRFDSDNDRSSSRRGGRSMMQSRGNNRYDQDDYDEDRTAGRGWFGDPEGHARAASQRGWEEEDDYRSRSMNRPRGGQQRERFEDEESYYDRGRHFSESSGRMRQRDDQGRFENYDRDQDREASRYSRHNRYDEGRDFGPRNRERYGRDYDEDRFSRGRSPANEQYDEDERYYRGGRY